MTRYSNQLACGIITNARRKAGWAATIRYNSSADPRGSGRCVDQIFGASEQSGTSETRVRAVAPRRETEARRALRPALWGLCPHWGFESRSPRQARDHLAIKGLVGSIP